MRVSATAKYIRRSTRKTRLVTQAIVGKPVEEATAILRFMPQGAAKDVAKVLKSAAANAENNHDLSRRRPVVVEAHRRRGTDHQALPAARPGARLPDPQADDPRDGRGREPGGLGDGSQGPPQRLPARRVAHLERQVVRRQGLHRPPQGGHDASARWSRRRLANASVSLVEIERGINHVTVTVHTAKPGIVIGKGGANVEALRQPVGKLTTRKVKLEIKEIRQPELDAVLVAANIAQQLSRRIAFRKAIKQAVQRTMKAGAKGVKIAVAGRLGGSEMARREWEKEGRIPLGHAARRHQLRPGPRAHDLRRHRRQGLDLPRRRHPRAHRAARARPRAGGRGLDHVDAPTRQAPQGAARPHERPRQGRHHRSPSATTR